MSPSSYIIREAVPSDAEGITHVHVKSWQTSYRGIIEQSFLDNISYEERLERRKKILHSKGMLQLVVTFEGEIVGFANAGPLRSEAYNDQFSLSNDEALKRGELYAIYLLSEHQGKHLGHKLYEECRRWFKIKGYHQFLTWGLADNVRARRFYESEGGKVVGEITVKIGDKDYRESCYVFEIYR
jgi:GNAT superfamily N-acetyltransferase